MTATETEIPDFKSPPLLVRWLGDDSSFVLTRFVILRLLGFVYFVAFASAIVQARALIGEHGLLPMRFWLDDLVQMSGSRTSAFTSAPSIFWIDSSDRMLLVACSVGAVLSLTVVLGVTNAGVMIVLWVLQLSLVHVGQIFWGYGWEMQLLETGMLGALLCPLRDFRPLASAPPRASIWLLRWLIVRIMLGAGLIKLRGDPCWRDLTCLVFHYETQPIPSPASWLLHQMPPWMHAVGVLFNHFVELVAPFMVLGPRRVRRVAGALFVTFQITLIVSGNLAFLNWLTIVPALACFDDELLARIVPKRFRERILARAKSAKPSRIHMRVAAAYAIVVAFLSLGPIANLFSSRQSMNASFEPLLLVNTYGAFGSVNRERNEIVLEGSNDGQTWLPYELPCKPGDVMRRPCLVTPWHYRFDWQMWFAAMSSYEEEPWIVVLVDDLLRGDRAVEPLFAHDPFPDAPPKLVRAELYRYFLTRRGDGPAWWRRERTGEYMRPVTRDDPDLAAFLRAHRLRR